MGRRAPLTGFDYFLRVNLRRLNRGGTLLETPPEPSTRELAPRVEPGSGIQRAVLLSLDYVL